MGLLEKIDRKRHHRKNIYNYQSYREFNTLMTVFGCYGISLYFCDVFLPQGFYEALFLPHRGHS